MKKNFKNIILAILFISTSILCIYNTIQKKSLREANGKYLKFKQYYQMLNSWLFFLNQNKEIHAELMSRGIYNIAIYGCGEMGMRLFESLAGTEVQVVCFIDRIADDIKVDTLEAPVYGVDELNQYKHVDAIIITPIFLLEDIRNELLGLKNDLVILSLEDIFE